MVLMILVLFLSVLIDLTIYLDLNLNSTGPKRQSSKGGHEDDVVGPTQSKRLRAFKRSSFIQLVNSAEGICEYYIIFSFYFC